MALNIDWGVELDRVVLFPLVTSGTNKGAPQGLSEAAYEGVEVPGPVSIEFSFGTPRTIPNISRGRVNDTIILPSLDPKTGVLIGSYNSQELNALLTGAKVTTMGESKVIPENTSEEGKEIQAAMLVQQLVSHDENGDVICVSEFFTKATLVPQKVNRGAEATAKNYQIGFGTAAKYGWGEALTLAIHGATKAASAHIESNNTFNIVTWLGDGEAEDFTLPTARKGLTSAKAKVWNWASGAAEPGVWESSTDIDTFTPTTPPAAGELLVVTYEF